MTVSRRDILAPHGQKFAIGDLVTSKEVSFANEDKNTLFRIIGSYAQTCSTYCSEDMSHNSGYTPPPRDSDAWNSLFGTYEVVNVKTGFEHAWEDEEDLTLVEEED